MATSAERLKEALELRRMKQIDLAKSTGIGKSSISTYLSGEYDPKADKIFLMAKVLDVNEAWLMGHDVPMERKEKSPASGDGKALDYENVFNSLSAEHQKQAASYIRFLKTIEASQSTAEDSEV